MLDSEVPRASAVMRQSAYQRMIYLIQEPATETDLIECPRGKHNYGYRGHPR